MGKIYLFDIGTRFRTDLIIDLAGYDTVEYKIEKPSGSILTKPCEIEDEATGIVYYDTVTDDLDEAGKYNIQVQVVFVAGSSRFESETKRFTVYDQFK
ncbi:MAG: hypothetical protein ACTSRJ_04830 [Candidatus Hodarchaeales archaeon]